MLQPGDAFSHPNRHALFTVQTSGGQAYRPLPL